MKLFLQDDVQARAPRIAVGLSRVGVVEVEKVVRIGSPGSEQLFSVKLDCFVDLGLDQKGAHMSRFEEVVNGAIGEVTLGEVAFSAEGLAAKIAEIVRDRQGARRAEVKLEARYPEHKPAPASGILTQEIYTLHGHAVASASATRTVVGVTAQGMTACPCAQELVAADARARLVEQGRSDDDVDQILETVPVATHNQIGLGSLYVGTTDGRERAIEASKLLEIVEGSMSSEIY